MNWQRIKSYHTIIRYKNHGYWIRRYKKSGEGGVCKPVRFNFSTEKEFWNYVLSRSVRKTRLLVLDRSVDHACIEGVYTVLVPLSYRIKKQNESGYVLRNLYGCCIEVRKDWIKDDEKESGIVDNV